MGYKSKQNLTTKGYQLSHKKKTPAKLLSDNLQLDEYYQNFYEKLRSKNMRKKSIENIIRSIMSRPERVANISSEQNRQLTLIDIDKLLSIKTGSLKAGGARITAMKRAARRINYRIRDRQLQPPLRTRIGEVLNFDQETPIFEDMDNERNNPLQPLLQRIQTIRDETEMLLNLDRFQTYRPPTFAAQPIRQIEQVLMTPLEWRRDQMIHRMRVRQINNPLERQILPLRRQMRGDRF